MRTGKSQAVRLPASDWVQIIQGRIEGLQFGVVKIIVQDGQVVQLDITRRQRLEKAAPAEPFVPLSTCPASLDYPVTRL